LCKTAAAIGDLQMLPKQTIITLTSDWLANSFR